MPLLWGRMVATHAPSLRLSRWRLPRPRVRRSPLRSARLRLFRQPLFGLPTSPWITWWTMSPSFTARPPVAPLRCAPLCDFSFSSDFVLGLGYTSACIVDVCRLAVTAA